MSDTITEQKLYDAAIRYLQRYASSADNLRQVLERRVTRWRIRTKDTPPDQYPVWIENALRKCVSLGFVNDAIYAEQRVKSLRRQGRSTSYIKRALQLKGIAPELIKIALGDDAEAELHAATRYVARRRLGKKTEPDARQKDLAKLVRAGFSLNIARQALHAPQGDDDYSSSS